MCFGVAVKREPVTHKWQAIGKVEGGETGAGIVAAQFFRLRGVVDVEEAFEKGVPGDGLVAFAAASALGGASPSFAVLVMARALQGVAGALLAP